jgi:hypothetical protein
MASSKKAKITAMAVTVAKTVQEWLGVTDRFGGGPVMESHPRRWPVSGGGSRQ